MRKMLIGVFVGNLICYKNAFNASPLSLIFSKIFEKTLALHKLVLAVFDKTLFDARALLAKCIVE